MAVNTVGDFIKSVFPTLINKKKSVFSALFANDSKTGTIETIFNELEETRKVWEIDSARPESSLKKHSPCFLFWSASTQTQTIRF